MSDWTVTIVGGTIAAVLAGVILYHVLPQNSPTSTSASPPMMPAVTRPPPPIKSISGTWTIRPDGQPTARPAGFYVIEQNGTTISVRGPDWTSRGTFDGKVGYYDWAFQDGSGRRGRTTISLGETGILHGQVRGSGANVNWDFVATRQ